MTLNEFIKYAKKLQSQGDGNLELFVNYYDLEAGGEITSPVIGFGKTLNLETGDQHITVEIDQQSSEQVN